VSFVEELKRRNVIKVAIAYIVVGWLAAQVAEFATENFGAPEWVLKTFVVFLILGLPFVVIGAWAFELTPDGIKREKDVDRSQSIAPQTGQKLNRITIGILTVAVAFLLIDKFVLQKSAQLPAEATVVSQQDSGSETGQALNQADDGTQSIAVLPFVNMSPDADNEYFSDGISEELLNVLAKVSTLRVASRTSAFAFKGKEMPVGEIARQLQVNNVLEGSVRKAGNRVRITAQLIDGKSDKHLWSETYERELDDIFQIQEDISNAIVDALKVALDVEDQQAISIAQHPTQSTEAYELYLQGRYLWRQRQEDNIRAAIGLFEQAIEIDPGFAKAFEALAAAHGSLSAWSAVTAAEALAQAVPYAQKALDLDPKLSEARAILAESMGINQQWEGLYEQYELALKNDPKNPTVMQWFAEILHNLGYIERALNLALKAYELDPTSPVLNNVITYVAISAQAEDLALKHFKIATDLGVGNNARNNIVPLLLKQRDIDRLADVRGWDEDEIPTCARAYQDASLKNLLLDELRGVDPFGPDNTLGARVMADCLALAGDVKAAMEIYERRIFEGGWYAFNDLWNHQEGTVRMRQSGRFKELVRKMGLDDFWRENGWPDLCRPVSDDDFECI